MGVMIAGTQFSLWRAVDDEGEVLDLLVQRRRDKNAAAKLICKLLKTLRTRGVGDGQSAPLRRRQSSAGTVGPHRAGLAQEQSGREFAPTRATAQAQDATLQIAWISAALLFVHAAFQRPASSHIRNTLRLLREG
jgi:hypothetical protein